MFIPSEWLTLIREGSFLYPCAGDDFQEALSVFSPYVSKFVFCDLFYDKGLNLKPVFRPKEGYQLTGSSISGDPSSSLSCKDGHKEIEPSALIEVYENEYGNRRVTVKRRRGFGQYSLLEFEPKSISVFMHRGDSPGEGGSNVYYFADCKTRYQPIGHLLTKLCERLTDRAILLSDGSNTRVEQLQKFHHEQLSGADAFSIMKGHSFHRNGFLWTCIGYLGNKYGPTLAWGLERRM